METTKTDYPDEIISAGQLLRILDSDAREISTLCQRACLRPKKDGFGNIYFSKGDVDILRKVKELYEHTKKMQDTKKAPEMQEEPVSIREIKPAPQKKDELDMQAETFLNTNTLPAFREVSEPVMMTGQNAALARKLENVETSIVARLTEVLSEKLDGLDEVIVELIKAKTENETLRQKVNELNKENFSLKTETASYKPVGFGFFVKKSTDDFTF